nr:actin-related protein 2/3 complex subunit 5A [Tanacetum cinerariifolium]
VPHIPLLLDPSPLSIGFEIRVNETPSSHTLIDLTYKIELRFLGQHIEADKVEPIITRIKLKSCKMKTLLKKYIPVEAWKTLIEELGVLIFDLCSCYFQIEVRKLESALPSGRKNYERWCSSFMWKAIEKAKEYNKGNVEWVKENVPEIEQVDQVGLVLEVRHCKIRDGTNPIQYVVIYIHVIGQYDPLWMEQ